jgi:hypothetical protein
MWTVLRLRIRLDVEGTGIEWGFKTDPEECGLSLHQPQKVCMVGVEYDYGCAAKSRMPEGRQKPVPGKERRSARGPQGRGRETGGGG